MAKQNATEKLDKQDFALEPGTQNLNEDKALGKADAKLLQDSIKALQALDEDKVDPDLIDLGYSQWHHEAAEDADDEFDTEDDSDDDDDENDYEEVRPLLVKKAKTGVQGMQSLALDFRGHRRRENLAAERIKAEVSLVSSSAHKPS